MAQCLDGKIGAVDNSGIDLTGGVAHVDLALNIDGYTAADVNVFASALVAVSGYLGIRDYERPLKTTLASSSVIVYQKAIGAGLRHKIEGCG